MSELFFSLQDDLDSVCDKFKNPKVTLIVRAPDLPDGDVVIGNDDLDAAIAAINRLKARTPTVSPTSDSNAPSVDGLAGVVSPGRAHAEEGSNPTSLQEKSDV